MIINLSKTFCASIASLWLLLSITSCSSNDNYSSHTVQSKDKLISCDKKRNGEIWLVLENKQEYHCIDGHWILQETLSSSATQGSKITLETISAYLEEAETNKKDSSESSSSVFSSSSIQKFSSSSIPSSSSFKNSSSFVSSSSLDSIVTDSTIQDSTLTDSLSDTLCANVPAGMMCDKRDGTLYPLVKIGRQVWFAKNLNFDVSGSYCYENKTANCTKFGRLYTWAVAMALPTNYNNELAGNLLNKPLQGICPEGYHVPSFEDFQILADFVDKANEDEGIGTSLKTTEVWNQVENIAIGTNRFGFSALPAGQRTPNGQFNSLGDDQSFWIAEESHSGNQASYWNLYSENDKFIGTYVNSKNYAYSVRCVKH